MHEKLLILLGIGCQVRPQVKIERMNMLKKILFFQTFTRSYLLKNLSVLSILIMATSCGEAVQNLEERARIEAAKPTEPVITSVSPEYGDASGGDTLTITGIRLSTASSVVVGSACDIVTQSATEITCTLAAGTGGAEDVVVTNAKSQATTLADAFTYLVAPDVVSVSPVGGELAGGETVTITGTNFYEPTDVKFGATSCTNITFVDSTTITCEAPAAGASTVGITVTNLDAQTETEAGLYTYKNKATISTITSTTPGDGTYKAIANIEIIVTFSEIVTTTNSSLTLSTGGSASYLSGSGSTAITYRYIPSLAHSTSDLDVTTFNLGDTEDALSVAVDSALPGGANLADNQDIIIDNIKPSMTNIALGSPGNGTYADGQLFEIIVTFDEAVTTGTSTLTMDTGGTASYFSGSGTTAITYRYISAASENATDLNITAVTAGDAVDAGGNSITLTLPSGANLADNHNVIIDTTGPTISSVTSTATGNGYYNSGDVIDIDVNFDEIVYASTPTLSLDTGATATYLSGSGTSKLVFTYTVAGVETSSDLDVSSITIGDVRDIVNNGASATIAGGFNLKDTQNIVVDTTDPTITAINSTEADATYPLASVLEINVDFPESIVTATSSLTLDSGGTAIYKSGSGTSTITYEYTVAAAETSADLAVTAFNVGDAVDLSGNILDTTLPGAANLDDSSDIVIDTIAPTITDITSSTGNATYNQADSIDIDLTFSEAVTGTTLSIDLDTGVTVDCDDVSAATTVTCTYTVGNSEDSTDLTVTAITSGNTVDDIGNALSTTLPVSPNTLEDSKNIVIDTTAPTILSMDSSTGTGIYQETDTIDIEVTFSEAVTATAGSSITLDSGASATYFSGDGGAIITYQYTVGSGENSADLNATSFVESTMTDSVGNAVVNTIPTAPDDLATAQDIVVDTTAPTITTITTTTGSGSYKDGETIDIVVNFSESVTSAGGTSTITLDTTDVLTYVSGSPGTAFTYQYVSGAGDTSSDLAVTAFSVGDIVDAAGNSAATTLPTGASALEGSKDIIIDTTAPTISSITAVEADGTYGSGTIDIEVTFAETVVATGASNITLDTGDTVTYSSGSPGTTLTFTYTIGAGDNSADLAVTAIATTAITDTALNVLDNTMPTGVDLLEGAKDIVVDTTVPTISSITAVEADGTYGLNETIDIEVTFSESVTATASSNITLGTGDTVTYSSGSPGTTLTFTYTIGTGDTSADLDVTAVAITDILDEGLNALDNTMPTGGNLLEGAKDIVVDTAEPAMQIAGSSDSDAAPYGLAGVIAIDVSFDKAVNVDATTELNLNSGGKAVYTSGTGTTNLVFTYTVGAGEATTDLTISSITVGDGVDDYNNPISTSLPAVTNIADTSNFIVDTVGPKAISADSSTGDGYYKSTDAIDIEVTFDENVTTCTSSTLTLDSGGTASYSSGLGTSILTYSYTVGASDNSTDLSITAVNAGDCTDVGGNAMDTTLPTTNLSANRNMIVDNTDPTILSITANPTTGTYGNAQTVDIEVTFSEAVNEGGSTLTLDTTGSAVYQSGDTTATVTYRYTVGSGDSSSDLDVSSISAGVTDLTGNTLVTTLPSGQNLADNADVVIDASPPTVTAISPQGGANTGGTSVTITGTNFDLALTDVQIGGSACTGVTVNSATELTCTTGVNTTGFKNIVVTNLDSTTGTMLAGYIYSPEVTVTGVSQSTGTIGGGETITITGTNFVFPSIGVTSVVIGGIGCGTVTALSTTELTCVTGAAAVAGTYDINVIQYHQTATLSSSFTYADGAVLSWQTGTTSNPEDWGSTSSNVTTTFTLENSGNADSTAVSVSLSGANSALWIIGTNTCAGAILVALDTCTVQATYLGAMAPLGSYSASLDATASSGGTAENGLLGATP